MAAPPRPHIRLPEGRANNLHGEHPIRTMSHDRFVISRLDEAGADVAACPGRADNKAAGLIAKIVRTAIKSAGPKTESNAPSPSAARITRMDKAIRAGSP